MIFPAGVNFKVIYSQKNKALMLITNGIDANLTSFTGDINLI